MIDREKVINGLECCGYSNFMDKCQECPYDGKDCFHRLKTDALTLLKEQEPRVMTYKEVLLLKFDDVVYFEVYQTKAIFSSIVIHVIPRIPDFKIGVVQFRQAAGYNGIYNAELSCYGKTWRCWTSSPTDVQRAAEPWPKEKPKPGDCGIDL